MHAPSPIAGRTLSSRRDIAVRVAQLGGGLCLFGVSISLLVRAELGLAPWDVLHQGLAQRTGLQIGWVVDIVGVIVLLAWIPLHQRPGFGTVANVVVIGVVANAALAMIPTPHGWLLRAMVLIIGVVANGMATGLYIGADLGPGPRDGLMTGLGQRGWSIRRARTVIELAVLAVGFALGGTVGPGTLLYAVSIGPLAAFFIPLFSRHQSGSPISPIRAGEPTRFAEESAA